MFLVFACIGLALMGIGGGAVAVAAWLIYPPLGIAVGGAEAFALGLALTAAASDLDDEDGEDA